jgi:GTP-binding protein
VLLTLNKTEGLDADIVAVDFHRLGLGAGVAVSATRGSGLDLLVERALEGLETADEAEEGADAPGEAEAQPIRVAVIGRPNVGKSTLINRLLGEERLIAHDTPGTTRDTVFVPFERDGKHYVLIDTAGVRRRARVHEAIEKFSVVKALQAIEQAHVVIGVLDAHDTIAEQDASLLGIAAEQGRAMVVAVNKWDGIPQEQRDDIRAGLDLRLAFLPFAPVHFISARHGTGVGELVDAVRRAYRAAMRELATPELTRALEQAIAMHQPPLVRGRRIKLRYAHQGGRNPPVVVIHGNQTQHVPDAYRRYLANHFRKVFRLDGTPMRIEFRTDANPFAGKRNELTPRQRRKRQRLVRHFKGR